jgi:hypothetical protein
VIGVSRRKMVAAGLVGLMVFLMLPGWPVMAADETDVEAEVEVLPGGGISYGARVTGFRHTLFPRLALGEPDNWRAFIFRNGWISIRLKDDVNDASMVSIWAANRGWHYSNIRVYVSADGKKWKRVGNEKVTSADFLRYDFTGSFGNVRYVRVNRSGWPWSFLQLDAVGAKGGD